MFQTQSPYVSNIPHFPTSFLREGGEHSYYPARGSFVYTGRAAPASTDVHPHGIPTTNRQPLNHTTLSSTKQSEGLPSHGKALHHKTY